jgi:hypothetical protein
MTRPQKINQSIGYYVGKKVSPRAGLKHKVSRLFNHLSVSPKGTQQRGDSYGPPNARNNKSHPIRARA